MNPTVSLTAHSVIGIINRGEAAMRFIRAAKEYNAEYGTSLRTVAFFVDEESEALFTKEADFAVPLSLFDRVNTEVVSPYLDHGLLLNALRNQKCDAVWAGWGFVSEDADFVKALEEAGICFLGPGSAPMASLGDKIEAKEIAEKNRVPILPWSNGPVRSLEEAYTIAERVEYPCILKAAHAGGGRGIRFVYSREEMEAQFTSARDETIRITGGDILFIERLVERGRHLEVQCLADRHGTVLTFGVRDCSVQRKNQKIIEETPPPGVPDGIIEEIQAAAARLLKGASYEGAGTVEFLFDLDRNEFYFMEVNTRLQVEHPITEILYDVDLVKGQIDVAFDVALPTERGEPRGHVVEARLNAEDPDREFTPAPGKVASFKAPAGPGIRVDSGIEQGSVIPSLFDSMVAKIIASGPTRISAIGRLERALRELRIRIEGGTTNRSFLLALLANPTVRQGSVHTRFVEEMLRQRQHVQDDADAAPALISTAIEQYIIANAEELANFNQQIATAGYPRDISPGHGHTAHLRYNGAAYEVLVRTVGDNRYHVFVDDTIQQVTYLRREQEALLLTETKRYNIQTIERGDTIQCEIDGRPYLLEIESSGSVKAPSPSIVLSIPVEVGQKVSQGEVIVTLEAMKMEMIVEAPEAGVIQRIDIKAGEQVAAGQELIQIEAEAADAAGEVSDAEPAERLRFTGLSEIPDALRIKQEFLGVFLGHDHDPDIVNQFAGVIEQSSDDAPQARERADLIVRAMELYASIGQLFSEQKVTADGFARPATFAELLVHYFKRRLDREKGMPEQFLSRLSRALRCYAREDFGGLDRERSILHRIYRSRAQRGIQQELLRRAIFALEELPVPDTRWEQLSHLLDEISIPTAPGSQALGDAAIHARYRLIDREILEELRDERREQIGRAIDLIDRAGDRTGDVEHIMRRIVDSGHTMNANLVEAVESETGKRRATALEMLARRFARDREIDSVDAFVEPSLPTAVVHSRDLDGLHDTIVMTASDADAQRMSAAIHDAPKYSRTPEAILLVDMRAARVQPGARPDAGERSNTDGRSPAGGRSDADVATNPDAEAPGKRAKNLFEKLTQHRFPVVWLSVGVIEESGTTYRTFRPADSGMQMDTLRGPFNPLRYRELRVHRLKHFKTNLCYTSEFVTLLAAQSMENPRDERFIALVEVPSTRLERNQDGSIRRMVAFEKVFTEAIYAMRAEQAKRRRRLQWNRIVIHIRSVLNVGLEEVREYGRLMATRAADLGLEKIVVYSRRWNSAKGEPEEIELLFENISGSNFSLRSRAPSLEPLQPMDAYTARVVRARQRGTVYPYELIKLITRTGVQVNERFPKGSFEEFDIEVQNGETHYFSVKGRAYGAAESNIVFGIIRSYIDGFPEGVSRVIVLSDTTGDMGSLSEPECRRVNAALDLAEKRALPVEWLPISAGARIDMESGTENLDWTAATLKRIIDFTQRGGEINVIVSGINVGAQSYWNAEATMLMHTRGLLIMTEEAAMLLTGKRALDFSGSVSAEDNLGIGGVERIMEPNGQAQIRVAGLFEAYEVLFRHYSLTWPAPGDRNPKRRETSDPIDRDVAREPYIDNLGQGFGTIGDIFSPELNPERKKPFEMRQVMQAVVDKDHSPLERWKQMRDAETAVVWECRIGGFATGLIGIESRALSRIGEVPHDGPESWSGGTLYPLSSKKVARGLNAFSGRIPTVILANLSGFDGSPESLRKLQLEYGAEIGRAVVNYDGPIVFVVVARYHGGAYVVFSNRLNENLRSAALEGAYASVIGGAPAAAVVFPGSVRKETAADERIAEARRKLQEDEPFTQKDFDSIYQDVQGEKQAEIAARFDRIHTVERAKSVGSLDNIIAIDSLRPYIVESIESGLRKEIGTEAESSSR